MATEKTKTKTATACRTGRTTARTTARKTETADGEDEDGDGLPDGEPDADEDGEDDGDEEDLLGCADGDLVGLAVGDVPMAGVRDGLTNLDRLGVRKALGATETRGVAEDDGRGEAGAFDAEEGAVATDPAPACGWTAVECGVRSAPISAKTATADAATRPPLSHAEASEREIRCRPGRSRAARPRRLVGDQCRGGAGQREEVARTVRRVGRRTILGKAGDERFGEPAGRGLDRTHLDQQLAGGGPVAGVLGQAIPDQPPQFAGYAAQAAPGC